MIKGRWIVGAFAVLLIAGCRQDMHDQPRLEPNSPSKFFANGTSVRPLEPGVVSRDMILDRPGYTEGKIDGAWVVANPRTLDEDLLLRGQERYAIYCSPCHGAIGDGNGMIVQRGYRRPPSLFEPRLLESADGYLYDVIANGYGVMPAYRAQVTLPDRWAIVAYLRALQLSQHANVDQLSPNELAQLEGGLR